MEAGVDDAVQYFQNRLCMSYISVRMLINQYAFVHGVDFARDGYIGKINPYCNVAEVVNKAYKEAAHMCDQHYENHSELKVSIHNNCEFVYVPSHLFHICFEIMKNSMRATMEFQTSVYPGLHITIANSFSDVTLRLSDLGGDIERELIPQLFKYTYTTAGVCEEGVCKPHEKPLAGDKSLMAGWLRPSLGPTLCPVFPWQQRHQQHGGSVETDAPEKLPLYSSATHKMYKEKQEKGPPDWTDVQDLKLD